VVESKHGKMSRRGGTGGNKWLKRLATCLDLDLDSSLDRKRERGLWKLVVSFDRFPKVYIGEER